MEVQDNMCDKRNITFSVMLLSGIAIFTLGILLGFILGTFINSSNTKDIVSNEVFPNAYATKIVANVDNNYSIVQLSTNESNKSESENTEKKSIQKGKRLNKFRKTVKNKNSRRLYKSKQFGLERNKTINFKPVDLNI